VNPRSAAHAAPRERRRWLALAAIAGLLATALGGCATADPAAAAAAAGLLREQISTDDFVLTAFARIERRDQALTVYIEGDGPAWRTRSEPSADPTPRHAIGLALAAADPAPNVAYLARPCQFTPMPLNPRCDVAYWTRKRFTEDVIASMNQALNRFAALVPGQQINLVGYSGGGALAVLLAARRSDVASIRTVAGNLDHAAVNRLHRVSPMPQSANAIDFASRVAAIPQIHFSGADDKVVPPFIARAFVDAAGARCAQARVLAGMAHDGDWSARWPALLVDAPRCSAATESQ